MYIRKILSPSVNIEMFIKDSKVAIVHDWLTGIGGSDRVLKCFHEMFPSAPIYTLFYDKKYTDKFLPNAEIKATRAQKLHKYLKKISLFLSLLPVEIESLDLRDYDFVISSSVIFPKGLILRPKTQHFVYCYSPTRQFWDWCNEYRNNKTALFGYLVLIFQHFMRLWDQSASSRPDYYIAISDCVRKRIAKYYKRESKIIYPPVNIDLNVQLNKIATNKSKKDNGYFLIVSRLYKHKNIDIAVHAFNKLGWDLVIIGSGPEFNRLKNLANDNIKLLGYLPDEELKKYYQKCLAFIMPQEEDFGITPIEAMSFGKPVLALKKGGALEYIVEGVNGEYFDAPAEGVLANGVRLMRKKIDSYNAESIRQTAEKFSKDRFKKEMRQYILEKLYEKYPERIYSNPAV